MNDVEEFENRVEEEEEEDKGVEEENATLEQENKILKQQNRAQKRRIDELTNALEREQQQNKKAKIILKTNSRLRTVEIYRYEKQLLFSTIKTLMGKRRSEPTMAPYGCQYTYRSNRSLLKVAMPHTVCQFLLDNWPYSARRREYLLLFNCAYAWHQLCKLGCQHLVHTAMRRMNRSNLLPRDLPFIELLCTPGLCDHDGANTSLERELALGRIDPPSVRFLRVNMNKQIYPIALRILCCYNWNVPDEFFQQ